MLFDILFGVVSLIGGAIASIAGFGIGSILTPTLATEVGTKLAVSTVSVPHLSGTIARYALIWRKTDKTVLLGFGIASAFGGLAGALLHTWFTSVIWSYVLGILLIFAGASNLIGFASNMRFGRRVAWIAGLALGLFGGLVGNQGGIRVAALFGFGLDKEAFVATGTAIGLVVDAARMSVYLATEWPKIVEHWPYVVVGVASVLLGTYGGKLVLRRIPEILFRQIVGAIIVVLGVLLMVRPTL